MASGNPNKGDEANEKRKPKDVKGLLRICSEATQTNDPNEITTFQPMSPERRKWLEEALCNLTVSPVEEMKKCINVIQNEDADVDDKAQSLETLVEWCEHIDFAIDFHKIGGFVIFPLCLEHKETNIRWLCLDLIAALVQNNPYCQKAILQHGMLSIVLAMLDNDEDAIVRTKSLFAISCLTRDCIEGLEAFIQHDGFSVIMRAMQSDIEKLKIKSAFMLSSICVGHNQCKDILCDMGMIDQLVGHLSEEHSYFHEHVLSALLSIVKSHARSVQECLKPELNLLTMLQEKIRELNGFPQFQEELEYTTELHKYLTLASSEDSDQGEAR